MVATIQIRRTPTPNNAPTGLAPGELAVEMATLPAPRLWVGVPTAIDATERRLLGVTAAARIYLATPQVVPPETLTPIAFDAVWYQADLDVDLGAGTIGVPVTGLYQLTAQVRWDSVDWDRDAREWDDPALAWDSDRVRAYDLRARRNGLVDIAAATTVPGSHPLAVVVPLDAGDRVSVTVDHTGPAAHTVRPGAILTFLALTYLGASRIPIGATPPGRTPKRPKKNNNGRRKGRVNGHGS